MIPAPPASSGPAARTTRRIRWTGVCREARVAAARELIAKNSTIRRWVLVARDAAEAVRSTEDLALFFKLADARRSASIHLLPAVSGSLRERRDSFLQAADRLQVLAELNACDADRTIVVTATPEALLQAVPDPAALARRELVLRTGDTIPFNQVRKTLDALEYDCEPLCEQPGQYAVRGGIIDVYPVTAPQPYRLDFFGDEIEEIRAVDPVVQRSGEKVLQVTLTGSPELELPAAPRGIRDYLPSPSAVIWLDGPPSDEPGWEWWSLMTDNDSDDGLRAVLEDVESPDWTPEPSWSPLESRTESLDLHRTYPEAGALADVRMRLEEEARHRFLLQLAEWRREGFGITLIFSREGEQRRAREILASDPDYASIQPVFIEGACNRGFIWRPPAAPVWEKAGCGGGLVVVTETEFFGTVRTRRDPTPRRRIARQSQVDQLLDFSELADGDHVVHVQHGIAVFRGLTRLETQGQIREVLSLEFDDKIVVHVPLQQAHLISRYVGLSKVRPQLGRIGANRWEKTRRAAEQATLDLAAELLQIQARRESQAGHAFPPDTSWQQEFEAAFPFKETPDQLTATEDCKRDMEKHRPMDRLICGDVGFGKTEVALRAAFKAVMDNRQAAVLVPTTVLAQQHLNTFRERFAGFPVVIEMISRFRSPAEQKKIIAAGAAGRIDILIGTHRLIQRDVVLPRLGLVVIDEEQRFGVKHKETFKRWRETVDVLSLSATPIPRTLYQALVGARDLSVIETPPINRLPIETIVKTYDDTIVVDAVRSELKRGGQVFYLHNRVQTIDSVAKRLSAIVPDARIAIGHGQMGEARLERIMTEFVAGRHDVLVCTTIIESGLDIPNCNTLIIEGADRFGLSQLYQIRGRVGRFRHQAYAYLLLHRHTRLLDVARHRLNAIRQHNQLGAGFRIAMRDLELRGAGNLLGAEQSGHIAGVGFDLYCQLLRQSIARLRGEKVAEHVRATLKLDFVHTGEGTETDRNRYEDGYTVLKDAERNADACPPIQARLPRTYLPEARLRIDIYRRLALADNRETLDRLEAELIDRFGRPPEETRALLLITRIRVLAEHKGLLSVETDGNRIKCLRQSGKPDDFILLGTRFPRLTENRPMRRLKEIIRFLNNLPSR